VLDEHKVKEIELEIFNMLQDFWDIGIDKKTLIVKEFKRSRQVLLIKDVLPKQYFDLYCKVVCIGEGRDGCQMIGVSDFTTSKDLDSPATLLEEYNNSYPDEVVVCLSLWDEHSVYRLQKGDYIFFRNLRCKLDSRDRPEFVLHGDQEYSDGRQAIKILNPEEDEVIALKEYYSIN
jgi:hypothetical protein